MAKSDAQGVGRVWTQAHLQQANALLESAQRSLVSAAMAAPEVLTCRVGILVADIARLSVSLMDADVASRGPGPAAGGTEGIEGKGG